MQERHPRREVPLAVVEEDERVGVVKVGPPFLGIGIEAQGVEGKPTAGQGVDLLQGFESRTPANFGAGVSSFTLKIPLAIT